MATRQVRGDRRRRVRKENPEVREMLWAGDAARTDLRACPKCSSELKHVEIFGNREAAIPLDADARFVETRPRFWDHDHCLICDVAIGRDEPWGYRESSFAGGPNSVGLWVCQEGFD